MRELTMSFFVRVLREARRYGTDVDVPEGSRVAHLSDTLCNQMADYLEGFAAQDEMYRRLTAQPKYWTHDELEAAEQEIRRLRREREARRS